MQLFKTMASNSDIMMTNDNSNPIDVFKMIAYKRKLFDIDTNANTRGTKTSSLKDRDRYRYIESNYGIVDSHTVKSPKTSGIQGNVNILQCWADRFLYREDYEVKYE